jgi:hypothetical protein
MKNIFKYLMLFGILFSIFSCREDEMPNPTYTGGSSIHFNRGVEANVDVLVGTDYKDVTVNFGTIAAVTGSHQVNLVVESVGVGTVQGTDFEILDGSDEVTAGEKTGTFTVRLFEPLLGQNKSVVFKLASTTLANSVFDQTYTLNWKLQCTIGSFLGSTPGLNFNAKYQFLSNQTYPVEVVAGTDPVALILKDYYEVGFDIKLKFNPSTGRYFADKQPTGYLHPTYGMVFFEIDDEAAFPSTADYCTRTMTLRPYMSVAAGYFDGNSSVTGLQPFTDTFTGL